MGRSWIATALILAAQGPAIAPSAAQETSDPQRLLRIIEAQQRRLDAQESQIAEQRRALQNLRREVEALQRQAPPPAKPGETIASAPASKKAPAPAGAASLAAPAGSTRDEWAGSLSIPGTRTRFKVGGYAELNVMHDTDAISTPSEFVTREIVTRNATAAEGADGQTNASVQPSRLELETRTPVSGHRLRTFVSVDFFNDSSSTANELKLREAYGEVSDILLGGDLLLGQTWSAYTNNPSSPRVLDPEGPNAILDLRHPVIRWTRSMGAGLSLKVGVEAPDKRSFENADPTSRWPDGAVALDYDSGGVEVQGSFLARDLRASGADGSAVSTFGWGASVSGRLHMPGVLKEDFATFSLTYGEGIGGVLNDAPPDASYDAATNDLHALPSLGWFAGYQHWWHPKLYSVLSYGEVTQDNVWFQGPTAYRKTRYGSANLTWTPYEHWLFGVEALYGSREDNDGEEGSDVRTQFTTRFTF